MAGLRARRRAYEAERGLVLELERRGWWATRVPASGRRSGFDVVAAKGGRILFIEVKVRLSREDVRIDRWRWEEVLSEAAKAGAEAYLAVRLLPDEAGEKWRIRPLADPDEVTATHAVFRHPSSAPERWMRLGDALG